MADVSVLTVVLSAGVSVCTGYVGTLMNYSRQRVRQRRTYGLSLLAEVKALQSLSRRHYGTFLTGKIDLTTFRMPKLRFGSADMSVFNNVSGNIGLFSPMAAVQIIEYYSGVRGVVAQAQDLADVPDQCGEEAEFRAQLADHLRHLRAVAHHGRLVTRTLRHETPTDLDQKLRICRRRIGLSNRRWQQRLMKMATSFRTGGAQ